MKKLFLNILQNSHENTFAEAIFNRSYRARPKNETPAHVLSCELFEIIKNIYFLQHLRMTASELQFILNVCLNFL